MERPILVAELGRGGMADVFLAMRRGLGGFVKLVVIKRLREGAIEGDVLAMFHDEARISARLNHPNVVQTHEVGFDGEHLRLEMEYLDGQPLHRVVNRAKKGRKTISHRMAVAVVREVLAGLHYAHELNDFDGSPLGIVHRDVSPQNIFITYDGRVKLVDFGIAKAAGRMSTTSIGTVKGKVRYMAPEQATGEPVDRRADVFAVGVVLWQLLVGRGYWAEQDDMAVFRALALRELPPRPRSVVADVPEGLDAVCARALSPNPDDRYATAEEFRHALEACMPEARAAHRELAELAAELFVDVRQSIRAEIERAAAMPQGDSDEPPTKLYTSASLSQDSVSSPEIPVRAAGERSDRPVSGSVSVRRKSPLPITIAAWSATACFALISFVVVARVIQPGAGPSVVDVPHPTPELHATAPHVLAPIPPSVSASVAAPPPASSLVREGRMTAVRRGPSGSTPSATAPRATATASATAELDTRDPASNNATDSHKLKLEKIDPWDAGASKTPR